MSVELPATEADQAGLRRWSNWRRSTRLLGTMFRDPGVITRSSGDLAGWLDAAWEVRYGVRNLRRATNSAVLWVGHDDWAALELGLRNYYGTHHFDPQGVAVSEGGESLHRLVGDTSSHPLLVPGLQAGFTPARLLDAMLDGLRSVEGLAHQDSGAPLDWVLEWERSQNVAQR